MHIYLIYIADFHKRRPWTSSENTDNVIHSPERDASMVSPCAGPRDRRCGQIPSARKRYRSAQNLTSASKVYDVRARIHRGGHCASGNQAGGGRGRRHYNAGHRWKLAQQVPEWCARKYPYVR